MVTRNAMLVHNLILVGFVIPAPLTVHALGSRSSSVSTKKQQDNTNNNKNKADGRWTLHDGVDSKEHSPWIDPDTPDADRTVVSIPQLPFRNDVLREFELVFSDEFNVDDRSMRDGGDPRWTALHSDDLTNNPLHWYSHDAVTTTKGVLNITLDVHPATFTYTDHTSDEIKQSETHRRVNITKEFRSGMVQSWNKFCFVGGIIEMSAKLPGDSHTGGLWPASTYS
jgi:hypothetical protein